MSSNYNFSFRQKEEERKLRFAQLQERIAREKENKTEQILLKAAQVERNLEEIQKTREDEHWKRREARERRKSETDARRQREEEERERKAAEILLDEKRK